MLFRSFGAGRFYQSRKITILNSSFVSVLGFIDNETEKQHTILDGCYIYPPCDAVKLNYDYILLMSKEIVDMKEQLLTLGVEDEAIISYDDYKRLDWRTRTLIYSECNGDIVADYSNMVILVSHELSNTGAPIVLVYMAIVLRKNGYYPIIVCKTKGSLQRKILGDRIPLIICNDLEKDNSIMNLLINNAKLIICNTLVMGELVYKYASMHKKVIWWIHEGENCYNKRTVSYCNNTFPNVAINAVSELAKMIFLQYAINNDVDRILPYGIPDTGYKDRCVEGKVRFFIPGSISRRKGQDLMIEAISLLTEAELNKTEFVFAGRIDEEEVSEGVRDCSLKQVTYLGEVSIDKMQELYKEIDVVVCPSREDPLPVVIAEGMMNKRVCIMTDNTGTAFLIKHLREGLICKAGVAESLADQIRWVLYNKEKLSAIQQSGREFYEKMFTMEAFEKRVLDLVKGRVDEFSSKTDA